MFKVSWTFWIEQILDLLFWHIFLNIPYLVIKDVFQRQPLKCLVWSQLLTWYYDLRFDFNLRLGFHIKIFTYCSILYSEFILTGPPLVFQNHQVYRWLGNFTYFLETMKTWNNNLNTQPLLSIIMATLQFCMRTPIFYSRRFRSTISFYDLLFFR